MFYLYFSLGILLYCLIKIMSKSPNIFRNPLVEDEEDIRSTVIMPQKVRIL